MRAALYRGAGDVAVEEVPDPTVERSTDAVVRVTTTAVCDTDLHLARSTRVDMVPGTILGHEAVGVVEAVGDRVRGLAPGDRVVIPPTIGCGTCASCRAGYYTRCDVANPNGPQAGICLFGGPRSTGPIHGLQAELARIPFAQSGPVKVPEDMSDDDAIVLSDLLPTAWFATRLAEVGPGDTVAVFGAGVVGRLAMASALLMGAGRVLAVDDMPSRLALARTRGAEPIDSGDEDPVEAVRQATEGIGADRAIDAVGTDAGAPTHALRWAVSSVAKGGTVGVVGPCPPSVLAAAVGQATTKDVTVNAGSCDHRRYLPELVDLVASGRLRLPPDPAPGVSLDGIVDAYRTFDPGKPGWSKVTVSPRRSSARIPDGSRWPWRRP